MRWNCSTLLVTQIIIAAGLASADAPQPYLLMPGDVLTVTVIGAPELNAPVTVTVRPDGTVSFPWVGEISVGGKTVKDTTADLVTALTERYRHVDVTVNLAKSHERIVFVLGNVVSPGLVALEGESIGIAQAIGGVGGLGPEASDVGRIYRPAQPPRTVDLPAEMGEGAQVSLKPGDVLFVEPRNQVTILGEVSKPGVYTAQPDARLSTVLALAGTFTPNADPHRAILVNAAGQTTLLDLTHLLSHPESPLNMSAADLRTLVVPPQTDLVVAGAVNTPGVYGVGSQARLVEAIAAAEGLAPTGDPHTVTVVDADGAALTVDYAQALAHPESEANAPVGSASVVVVAERRNAVAVLGEVRIQGSILSTMAMPLSAVLAEAGGLSPAADVHRVQVIREGGGAETVDAAGLSAGAPIAEGGPAGTDVLVAPGDTVVVAHRYARVIVLGAVKNAGPYEFEEGDTAVEAIARAGGFENRAVKRSTSILRRDGDTVQVISLNMAAALRGSQALLAEPLQDRDIVYVPVKAEPPWREISTLLVGTAAIVRLLVH